jgi:carboxylate-amine ligase
LGKPGRIDSHRTSGTRREGIDMAGTPGVARGPSVANGGAGASPDGAAPTVGVEEEFLLVDAQSGAVASRYAAVRDGIDPDLRELVCPEYHASQLEAATPVCRSMEDLHAHLVRVRRAAAAAAERAGVRLLAVGTAVQDTGEPPVSPSDRYRLMADEFGALGATPGLCGCHVHVAVPDRDEAVQVCNHLRPWLPLLQAITANSPFYAGRDTGHASWRSVLWGCWPSTGPTPYFASAADYDRTVAALMGTGVMLDEAMVYWYARPSASYPTVEVRVGDVCLTAGEATLVAGLIRALVASALEEVRAGRPAPVVPEYVLRAAHWRAARDGLDGEAIDLAAGGTRPAWELLDDLVGRLWPALSEHGDLPMVTDLLARLRADGCGATRQRRTAARRHSLSDVTAMVAEQTVRG